MLIGGCLCGACRFEYAGEVGSANYCHCADCRRATGSAFNVGVRLKRNQFHIVAGSPKAFTTQGDSGATVSRHFCADCGSPLFTSSPRRPEWVFAKAGALDDPFVVKPDCEIWASSETPWARIPVGIVRHDKNRVT
ncbi:MAG TPA: GFA family protein [Caulobacteraceae bacterium]|nr:GFA family protein [Caulobacteraceae bacterium]